MDEKKSMMSKYTIIAVLVTVALAGALLYFVSRGKSYNVTVLDPMRGTEDAPVVIEEFADFQCPACRAAVVVIEEAVSQYPTEVKYVFRDFPLPEHPYARTVAAAALCAAQQNKFWEYHDKTYEKQPDWSPMDRAGVDAFLTATASELGLNTVDFDTCRRSRQAQNEVDRDFKDGVNRGINATPTFFINGTKVDPARAASVFSWTRMINEELQKKGLTPENQKTS